MRLLSIANLSLHTFASDDQVPAYGILSHTWGDDEVLLRDIEQGTAWQKRSFEKIVRMGELTAADGLEYFWMDNCCIDKSSSAELSEAINSMFRWYRRSSRCYTYLEDVVWSSPCVFAPTSQPNFEALQMHLSKSRWFTRGWTLQELLAPDDVQFYDRNWEIIGSRSALSSLLTSITTIDQHMLDRESSQLSIKQLLEYKSVAQRMSWAAHRHTTRPEDLAYCLMGLFDIHIPLMYGEGLLKAFFRLQAEIMKSSTDQTILAWSHEAKRHKYTALATSPHDFAACQKVVAKQAREVPFKITNKGLKIKLPVSGPCDEATCFLACHEEGDSSNLLTLRLSQSFGLLGLSGDIFIRHAKLHKEHESHVRGAEEKVIYLPVNPRQARRGRLSSEVISSGDPLRSIPASISQHRYL